MRRYDMPQLSQEWYDIRLGIPTASQFHRIITPRTMKPSASATGYMHELLAETMIRHPVNADASAFMERGVEMEESAVEWYEFQRDVETETVGFVMRDDRQVGCSPDRLVGDDGVLEVKVPSAHVHVSYLLGGTDAYKTQIQGGLWVAEREWTDFLSYNPEMPQALVRVERDEVFISALAEAVGAFVERLKEAREKMRKLGYVEREVA
jgi:hypothetical protein